MTTDEWIAEIDAPDLPLAVARAAYHNTRESEHREAYLLAIVRAERRLAVCYAPEYVRRVLAGGAEGMAAAELAAFEAARRRDE